MRILNKLLMKSNVHTQYFYFFPEQWFKLRLMVNI